MRKKQKGLREVRYTCLEAEIPNAGDWKRSQIGTKQVVAVRDAAGGVNVLLNRCAHRSAQFCNANHGNAKEIVCPYHQWTYDLQGKLVGVPFRKGYRGEGGLPDDFRMEDHGLRRLRVARRGGAVFSSFSDATEPFEAYLGPRQLEFSTGCSTGGRSRCWATCASAFPATGS